MGMLTGFAPFIAFFIAMRLASPLAGLGRGLAPSRWPCACACGGVANRSRCRR
ncbi:hypothetical protein ACU4GD_13705 [Cupriavidus basilensis]